MESPTLLSENEKKQAQIIAAGIVVLAGENKFEEGHRLRQQLNTAKELGIINADIAFAVAFGLSDF